MEAGSSVSKPHDSSEAKDDTKATTDEEIVCCVCFNGDVEEENEIVICSGCDCSVHQGCYGITSVPADDWYCKKCKILREWEAEGKKTPKPEFKCLFCPHPGGAFSPTEDGRWCHTVCASWIPETGFNDTKTMDYVVGISSVDPARFKTKCELCGVKGGIIQCIHGVCRYAFHVMCGWQHKLRIEVREVPPIKDGDPFDVGQLAYCPAHRNEKFDPVKYTERSQERYRDDPEVAAKIAEREKREGGKKKRKKSSDDDATDPEEGESEEFEEEGSSRKKKKGKGKGKKSKGKRSGKRGRKQDDEDYEDEEEEEKETKPEKAEKPEKSSNTDGSTPAQVPVASVTSASGHKCPNCGSNDLGHLCSMKVQLKAKPAAKKDEEDDDSRKPRKRGRPKKQQSSRDREVDDAEDEDGMKTIANIAAAAVTS